MKVIPLTRGLMAMIDDEDFERVSKYSWRAAWTGKTRRIYAVRTCTKIEGAGKRRTIYLHNFIMGEQPIDHKNGNSLDCQKHNLRKCDRVTNGYNRKIQKHSSKFKGVSLFKATGKWQSSAQLGDKKVHLGFFEDEHSAARAYDTFALKHFGEFARTNQQMGAL